MCSLRTCACAARRVSPCISLSLYLSLSVRTNLTVIFVTTNNMKCFAREETDNLIRACPGRLNQKDKSRLPADGEKNNAARDDEVQNAIVALPAAVDTPSTSLPPQIGTKGSS
ncbi:hypothetical protein QQF64_025937 [Cirrhinus molitorella]|uniref:Uncharacterized protein n=1 Tax=Cirrhinus molitorella TaxID=172907 RepID=A0ABR3NQR3_9TELE